MDFANYTNFSSDNLTNYTVDQYLLDMRGPKQLPLYIAVPFTLFNLVIFVTGIVGNISVCVVIVRHPSMHSATNYYLFSLAVSDLTLLIFGLPNDVTVLWHQYPWTLGVYFCKFRAFVSESASYVSVLTIVAFSMERYLAICHPLHLCAMSGFQRAVRIIAVLWVLAFASAAPFAIYTSVHYLDFQGAQVPESAFCGMLTLPETVPISEISTIVFFIVPMLVIMVLYIRMGLKIRRRSLHSLGSVHGESRQSQSRKAIIRMLAAVVIAFFICWAPFHAQRLIFIYGQKSPYYLVINEWMFYITGLLYYVSSTVNPILYNVMSNRYRVAFRETLCCGRKRKSNGYGLSRDHSSFRETTRCDIAELVRVKSVMGSERVVRYSRYGSTTNAKDKSRNQNCVSWQEDNKQHVGLLTEETEDDVKLCVKRTDVVVVMKPAVNGKAKCYTANGNEENHILAHDPDCMDSNRVTNHVETRI